MTQAPDACLRKLGLPGLSLSDGNPIGKIDVCKLFVGLKSFSLFFLLLTLNGTLILRKLSDHYNPLLVTVGEKERTARC